MSIKVPVAAVSWLENDWIYELEGDFFAKFSRMGQPLQRELFLDNGKSGTSIAPYNNIEFRIGDVIEIQCTQIGGMTNPVVAI